MPETASDDLGLLLIENWNTDRKQFKIGAILLFFAVFVALFTFLAFFIDEYLSFLGGMAVLAPLLYYGVRAFRGATYGKVELYEGGVIVREPQRTVTLPWRRVSAIRYEHVQHINVDLPATFDRHTRDLTLEGDRGERVVIADPMARTVYPEALKHTTLRLLEAARAQLHGLKPVTFGALQVTQDGLKHGGSYVRWPMVGIISVSDGTLLMKNVGGVTELSDTADVPNLAVLLALLREDFGVRVEGSVVR